MAKKPPKRDPIIVYKREEKGLRPFLRQSRGFKFGPPPGTGPQKQRKPKEIKTVVPEKVRLHIDTLAEIDQMPSPEKEIVRACYFMSFLVHETKSSNELFPLKHKALEKIFKSGHNCLTVNYVQRGDREIYHLSPEAEKKWEKETGSNKHHLRMYLTPKCKVEFEEGYFDLTIFTLSSNRSGSHFICRFTRLPGLPSGESQNGNFTIPKRWNTGLFAGRL